LIILPAKYLSYNFSNARIASSLLYLKTTILFILNEHSYPFSTTNVITRKSKNLETLFHHIYTLILPYNIHSSFISRAESSSRNSESVKLVNSIILVGALLKQAIIFNILSSLCMFELIIIPYLSLSFFATSGVIIPCSYFPSPNRYKQLPLAFPTHFFKNNFCLF
jgi:hypothetical protein